MPGGSDNHRRLVPHACFGHDSGATVKAEIDQDIRVLQRAFEIISDIDLSDHFDIRKPRRARDQALPHSSFGARYYDFGHVTTLRSFRAFLSGCRGFLPASSRAASDTP